MSKININEIKKEFETAMKLGDAPIGKYFACTISKLTAKETIDYINQLEAEAERLNTENRILSQKRFNLFERLEFTNKIRDKAIKEFAEKMHTEIHQALESNYKARAERAERIEKYNIGETDEFISYCEGKIATLRGIDDFVDSTTKEMVGDT